MEEAEAEEEATEDSIGVERTMDGAGKGGEMVAVAAWADGGVEEPTEAGVEVAAGWTIG